MITAKRTPFLPALALSVGLASFVGAASHTFPGIPSFKDFGSPVKMAFNLPEDWLAVPYDSKDWKFSEKPGYETAYMLSRRMGTDVVETLLSENKGGTHGSFDVKFGGSNDKHHHAWIDCPYMNEASTKGNCTWTYENDEGKDGQEWRNEVNKEFTLKTVTIETA